LWRCLLDRVHEELKHEVSNNSQNTHDKILPENDYQDLSKKGNNDPPDPKSQINNEEKIRSKKESIVTDVFEGVLLSRVKCLNCRKESSTRDKFLDLSISIPMRKMNYRWLSSVVYLTDWVGLTTNTVSLEDCMKSFCQTEVLSGGEKFKCEFCKSAHESEKTLSIVKSPEVLCIHVKRFSFDSYFGSKLLDMVVFPLRDFDLAPFFDQSEPFPPNERYNLFAIISHSGSFEGGHYISYCLNSENKLWYEYNDSSVSEVSERTVLNSQAYVIFYQKQDHRGEEICAK